MGRVRDTLWARRDLLDLWSYRALKAPTVADRIHHSTEEKCRPPRGHRWERQPVVIIYETIWFVAISAVAALLVHEGGHVVGALATGQTPRVLTLGLGPVILRLRRPGFAVILRAVPITGYVLVEPTDRAWAYVVMVAGGPCANLLALAGCLWAHAIWPASDLAVALAIYQGLFALGTLFPAYGKIGGIRVPSDGMHLYSLLRVGRTSPVATGYAAIMSHVEPKGAPALPVTRHAARLMFELVRADQFVDAWARREAFVSLRALLVERDLTRQERALILCVLCGQEFIHDEGNAGAEEMDSWSREALALTPEPLARDARGAVFLAAGRRREAETLLRDALDGYCGRDGVESPQAVLCRASLARAVDLAGRADEAQTLWREAETAPVIVANPRLREILTRIKCRALPAEDGSQGASPAPAAP